MDVSPQQPGAGAPVVVGVDGSAQARAALRAALSAAAVRSTRLVVLSSYSSDLYWLGGAGVVVPVVEDVRGSTRRLSEELLASVRAEVPEAEGVPVSVEVTPEPPAVGLVTRSAEAQLVVVGNRGRGAVRSALLGSVALHTVTHAHCPVLVVHVRVTGPAAPLRVVVGIDGSAASRAALAAAVEEAGRIGAVLHVVATYVLTDNWVDLSGVVVPSREEIRDDLRGRVDEAVGVVLAASPADATVPRVDVDVVEGAAWDVLVDRARDAVLLVVGGSGRGAVRGLLVGSVALHCAMHAPCPVLVLHPAGRRAGTSVGAAAPALV
ncbi:universal stress protein [Geodermatophilus normandii]|uniref:Universal stress protein n=1 Tax=Geodermatophilus normandii TaxID=1137989 RepID=A0A6P0GG52_9ACTN|nr:universal stress protein [Geodermatophilus normandii]NEM06263.1 universal stress protein [Geodermatophilus normandii]